jgi:hypothetical protein
MALMALPDHPRYRDLGSSPGACQTPSGKSRPVSCLMTSGSITRPHASHTSVGPLVHAPPVYAGPHPRREEPQTRSPPRSTVAPRVAPKFPLPPRGGGGTAPRPWSAAGSQNPRYRRAAGNVSQMLVIPGARPAGKDAPTADGSCSRRRAATRRDAAAAFSGLLGRVGFGQRTSNRVAAVKARLRVSVPHHERIVEAIRPRDPGVAQAATAARLNVA